MNDYFYEQATDALQFLDELGGPDTAEDYIAIMQRIAAECLARAETAASSHRAIFTDTRHSNRLELCGHDVRVRFHSQGGGFECSVPLAEWQEHMRAAPVPAFKLVRVTGDWLDEHGEGPEVSFPAYSDGNRWNGWVMPHFTKETALDMLTASGNTFRFDAEQDAIIVERDDIGEDAEIYQGEDIDTPEGRVHVYPVGAGMWTWDIAS